MRGNKPIPIDNNDLMCGHGIGLSPYDNEKLKCVSDVSWSRLESYCGGGPCVQGLKVCKICLESYCKHVRSDRKEQSTVGEIKRLLQIKCTDGFYISSGAVTKWKKGQSSLESLDILAGVMCKHGRLDPAKSKRKVVCNKVWLYFSEGTGTKKFFTTESPECEECLKEKMDEKGILRAKDNETRRICRAFSEFFENMDAYYLSQGTFYVIERKWYNEWKRWLDKRSMIECPRKLDNESLICHDHGKLLVDLNSQKIDKDMFVLMKSEDWEKLCENFVSPTCKKIVVKRSCSNGEARVNPEICYECIIRSKEMEEYKRVNFEDSYITIYKLPDIYDSEDDILQAVQSNEESDPSYAKDYHSSIAHSDGKRHCK